MSTADDNPYRPPVEHAADEAGAAPQPPPEHGHAYVPGGGRARAAIILLHTSAWISGFGLVVSVLGLPAEAKAQQDPDAMMKLAIASLITLASAAIAIPTLVTFCLWFHRAYTNVQQAFLVQGLRYSPGWAAGGFFVPFANLVVPHGCGREIWIGSHPGVSRIDDASANKVGTGIVALWWGLFLVVQLSAVVGSLIESQEATSLLGRLLLVVADLGTIAGAVVSVRMIRRVEQHQRERAGQLVPEAGAPPPPTVESSLQTCPHCGWRYDPEDYSPDAAQIYCDGCKGELPRVGKTEG